MVIRLNFVQAKGERKSQNGGRIGPVVKQAKSSEFPVLVPLRTGMWFSGTRTLCASNSMIEV